MPAGASAHKNKIEVLDREATILALEKIIRNGAGDARVKFVEQKAEHFEKDPVFMTGVARAWYFFSGTGDTVQCFKYIDRAIAIDPTYAPAYVQAAEICKRKSNVRDGDAGPLPTDTLEAIAWLEKGMKANPKAPECYYEYAILAGIKDTNIINSTYKQLAVANPSCPVELYRARTYRELSSMVEGRGKEATKNKKMYPWLHDNLQLNNRIAMNSFAKADPATFERDDFVRYSHACVANGQLGCIVDTVCPTALKFFPRDAGFNRMGFLNAMKIGESNKWKLAKPWYEKALKYADELFNNSDSANVTAADKFNYALVFFNKHDYEEAIAAADVAMAFPGISDDNKTGCLKIKMDSYKSLYKYDEAINVCKAFNAQQEAEGKLTYLDLERLAQMYQIQASELSGLAAEEKLQEVISVYEEMYKKFDDLKSKSHACYSLIRFYASIDPDYKDTQALDASNKLIDLIEPNPQDVKDQYKDDLAYAYAYVSAYYYMTANGFMRKLKLAGENAVKALEMDPNNYNAQVIYRNTRKYLPKSLRKFDHIVDNK